MAAMTAPVNEIGYAARPSLMGWMEFADDEPTPELRWPRSIEVYDAMRSQDSQVGSVLRAVTYPVRRTPWRINPAGARDEIVEFVADNLGLPIVGAEPRPLPRTRDRFSWTEHLRLALLMLPFGHAYFEQVYRITDDGTRARLRKLAIRMPKTIEHIDVADDGGLVSITQFSSKVGHRQRPIPVDRLVAYVLEREGGNWLGKSVLRNCYKNWLLKDRLLRVDAQTIERNGMGIPLYKAGETEKDLTAGKQMAQQWRAGATAGGAVPHGSDMVLRGVEGDLPQALPSVRYHDEQIGRSVLAHFLNLGQQTGSWALGSTFADFFTMSLQTLAEEIADVANQHIVEDLVDANWGEDEPAPLIVPDEIGSKQAATAQALKWLVEAGILRPDRSLEEATRQHYALPSKDNSPAPAPADDGSS